MHYVKVHFWGVRGSIPSPLRPDQVEEKISRAVHAALAKILQGELLPSANLEATKEFVRKNLTFEQRSWFGGNTTCVEVCCDDFSLLLDMGSGIRERGIARMKKIMADRGEKGVILQTHLHWDHIQGFPFWAEVYLPRSVFDCEFDFYGGPQWDTTIEDVLRGQMEGPVFPVNMKELSQTGMKLNFHTVYDGTVVEIPTKHGLIKVLCHKMNHPQETYGYRIEYRGEVVTFCPDHEPYAAGIPKGMLALARGADIFISDCQYSKRQYTGEEGGVPRMGWGHSFPEYVAEIGKAARPKTIVTFHHDPVADEARIQGLAMQVEANCEIKTIPAYEGLVL